MPPKTAAKGTKKTAISKSTKPMKPKEGGGKAKKKKWSKGKVRDKLNNLVLFDQPTYDKFLKEVPQYKLITPSVVSERLKIRASLARHALAELHKRAMCANGDIAVLTERLCMVPYSRIHVPKYHSWMQSEHLRRKTCSERLSLDEEYESQEKWMNASDRVTCILLDVSSLSTINLESPSTKYEGTVSSCDEAEQASLLEIGAMIGDVNIFFTSKVSNECAVGEPRSAVFEGELSIMIAESQHRGRGFATEAIAGLLTFVGRHFPDKLNSIVAKVTLDNLPSLRLFQDRLGFVERSRCDYFNHVGMKRIMYDFVRMMPLAHYEEHTALVEFVSAVEPQRGDPALATAGRIISKSLRGADNWRYEERNLTEWRSQLATLFRAKFC